MKAMMRVVFFVVLIGAAVIISLAVTLGIPLGLGWILTRFLPFSLFEGTLLSLITLLAIGVFWYRVFSSTPDFGYEREEDEVEDAGIPQNRFWRSSQERTWQNWFQYVLANGVYEDVADSPGWAGNMDEKQQQELSIRLADAALTALKRRAAQAKQLKLTRGMLKQELVRRGQRPYEDELLDLAVTAVNVELAYLEDDLREVARRRLWDNEADI
jgi:hypothetical protein